MTTATYRVWISIGIGCGRVYSYVDYFGKNYLLFKDKGKEKWKDVTQDKEEIMNGSTLKVKDGPLLKRAGIVSSPYWIELDPTATKTFWSIHGDAVVYFLDTKKMKGYRMEDGKTHVNVYSKGKTWLGRQLSNFAYTPFECEDGRFDSIEAYWYWLKTGNEDLRELHGFEAKQLGKKSSLLVPQLDPDVFRAKIKRAIKRKLLIHPNILEELHSALALGMKLEHYYVFNGKRKEAGHEWVLDAIIQAHDQLMEWVKQAPYAVNLDGMEYDLYIGRRGKGEDGYFGNPFSIGRSYRAKEMYEEYFSSWIKEEKKNIVLVDLLKAYHREGCIKMYEKYARARCKMDPGFRERIRGIPPNTRLGCFCAPDACHGDVIRQLWLELNSSAEGQRQGQEQSKKVS